MCHRKLHATGQILTGLILASLAHSLSAQVEVSQSKGNPAAPTPKWDIFVGYSILDPRGTYYPIQPDGSAPPVRFKLEKVGWLESSAHYFNRGVGLQVESGQHDLARNTGFPSTGSSNSGILTLEGGLIYRWPGVHLTPFVHGLGGAAYVDGPDHEPYTWGPGVTGGGGLDWYFGCHFGIRIFQADYEYFHINSGVSHGTLAADDFVWADDENINAIRLASGVVFRAASAWTPVSGCGPRPPIALACNAANGSIYAGEPVTVTAVASGLNPKLNATYTWTGVGVTSNGSTATVPTDSLAPGTYTVRATVSQGSKAGESAECEASFTVLPILPPTLVCTAGPMIIHPDQTSSVTLTAISPQNRPLTYACTSSSGSMNVTGNVATLTPAPGQSGAVMINCTAKDDKGQTAACNTAVTVELPPAVLPRVKPLCVMDFSPDTQPSTRVNNEAKACLDDVALQLQQDPNATLVVVGEETSAEADQAPDSGAQRAVNTKEYLTKEKGIDPSRIVVRKGSENGQEVQPYLAPQGSNFDTAIEGTTPVDEQAVKPVVRKPLTQRRHEAKPAAKKPAKSEKKKTSPTNTPQKPVDGP